ncbi:DUF86 domain-containing protein [candidate division KSB1 bacterium]|nr:DUF86 domain-containing protein [candidate division KSB1 bacterium]
MQIDKKRIEKYLRQIKKEYDEISEILQQSDQSILESSLHLRSLKYSLIVINEAIANVLQHILAKKFKIAISGYTEIFKKAKAKSIISEGLIKKLKPFIDFRNMLIHQYWVIEDKTMLKNLRDGLDDFKLFVKEIKNLIDKENGK